MDVSHVVKRGIERKREKTDDEKSPSMLEELSITVDTEN